MSTNRAGLQAGLQKFARDLIEVAKTDDEAKAIVTKYGIAVTNSGGRRGGASSGPAGQPLGLRQGFGLRSKRRRELPADDGAY